MTDSMDESAGALSDQKHSRRERAKCLQPDRLPPNSPESEQGVLGCILLSPEDGMAQVLNTITDHSAFYDLRHQTIYLHMVQMYDQREAIDLITLQNQLKNAGVLADCGGLGYLATLPDTVPSASNISYYLDILVEKHELRQMIQICTESVNQVYQSEGEYRQVVEKAERGLLALLAGKQTNQIPIRAAVNNAINAIESAHQRQGIKGIATGFVDLDKLTSGLHPTDMIVLAARPSMGKTSLAMNIVEHVAIDQAIPVGIFSLEMSTDSLVMRMLCSRAKVDAQKVREGFLCERDFPKLSAAAGKIAKSPIFIDDTPGLSIMQLRSKARRMHQLHNIRLLVIDYLQLLKGGGRHYEKRHVEMTDVSNGVKALAKELGIPVIVLSQLNREIDKEKNRKPRLSDLRETGAIEQDADLVLMLYRPDDEEESAVNMLVPKQRNGPTGEVVLTFLKPFTRFENRVRIAPEQPEQEITL